MRHCGACGVSFSGDLDTCPLCQEPLTGTVQPAVFPRNEVKRSGAMALRLLALATGVAVLATLVAGYALGWASRVVLAVCLGLLTTYVFVRHALSRVPDFLRLVARYFVALLAVAVVWAVLSGSAEVATYAVPGVCLAALVCDAVLLCMFRGTFVTGYAKYLLLNLVFGLVPLVFVALGRVSWNLPSCLSALAALALLVVLVVFMRERLANELRKLFDA